MSKKSRFVPRVTQLDSVELDNEVMRVLKDQLLNAGKHFEVGLLGRWEPELEVLLAAIVWKLSVARGNATFGQQLLGLELSAKKAGLLAVIMIAPRYLSVRGTELARLFGGHSLAETVSRTMSSAETLVRACSVINLACFLRGGRYATLPHRLLRLSLVAVDDGGRPAPGFQFMLRELLWHGFIELLVFTLPLVNWHWLRRRLYRPTPGRPVAVTANRKCPVCSETPVLPHAMGCGHAYCYYCINSHHLADSGFQCLLCGFADENPDGIKPWKPRIA